VPSVLNKKGNIKSVLHKMLRSKSNKAFSVKATKTSIIVCKLKNKSLNGKLQKNKQ